MTRDVREAVAILKGRIDALILDPNQRTSILAPTTQFLRNAIRHLAYPDRDVYPKTRRGTKGAPIVRR